MKNELNNLPISAVVVTYNEERYLKKCLESISFCQEIIVIDLGSKDESINISNKYATKVIHHEKVEVVEMVHAKIKEYVSNEWVLIIDPDEMIDISLSKQIINIFESAVLNNPEIGSITVPWWFYFKNKRLKGTIWGGANQKVLIVNLNRFQFSKQVHSGRKLIDGFITHKINLERDNIIHHYWMSSYTKLFEKHKRYIKQEGESRYLEGKRTNKKHIIKIPFIEFKKSYFQLKGYKDGIKGLFLSLFWSWYCLKSEINLFKYQNEVT